MGPIFMAASCDSPEISQGDAAAGVVEAVERPEVVDLIRPAKSQSGGSDPRRVSNLRYGRGAIGDPRIHRTLQRRRPLPPPRTSQDPVAKLPFDMYVRARPPWFRPEDHAHMLEGLRKAGWRE
jgi:hypothetical protein